MQQGTVKDYDVDERTGTVLLDDRTEVKVDAVSTQGTDIRYLRLGQRVKFDVEERGGEKTARRLRLVTFD